MMLEEVTVPAPKKGQVLVRVRAASANPMDWKVRSGGARILTGWRFPRGVGHDFAGDVAGLGEGVTSFQVNEAVFGGIMPRPSGAFAEWAIVEEKRIAKKPAGISYEVAAAIPTVGVTALQALHKGKLQAGQSIFISGCLGGVGRIAAQLARSLGASVAGSCREAAKHEAIALGIDPVVPFDFDKTPLRGQFNLVFDMVGSIPLEVSRYLLKSGGSIVDIASSPGKIVRGALSRDFKMLFGSYKPQDLQALAEAAANKQVDFPIARVVGLEQAIEALTELELRGTPKGGKLIVAPRS